MNTSALRKSRLKPMWLLLLLVATSCLAPGSPTAGASPAINTEYKVKATCLFHFAQFVEWPALAFADPAAPLTIGVLGQNEFGTFLDGLIKGETIKGHPIVIHRAQKLAELPACHILFISKSAKAEIPQILASVAHSSVLTVSEVEGFARSGGIINFCVQDGKVRFGINLPVSQSKGLKISAQLMQLSEKGCL